MVFLFKVKYESHQKNSLFYCSSQLITELSHGFYLKLSLIWLRFKINRACSILYLFNKYVFLDHIGKNLSVKQKKILALNSQFYDAIEIS